jgi:hypothetical protein
MSNFSEAGSGSGGWGDASNQSRVVINLVTCQNCTGIIAVFINWRMNVKYEMFAYPPSIPKVDQSVPQKIASDYVSAVNCMAIGENKPAVSMFRRVLQQLLIDKGASHKARIVDQIDDLATKNVIDPALKEWAHEIRLWGNMGAHPDSDGLDEISTEEVVEVRNFLDRMFEYLYIMPAKLHASRLARSTKKTQP